MSLTNALVRVNAGASDEWKDAADKAIEALALTRETFNSDEIWNALFALGVHTPEHRAMGPRILSAKARGIIELASCDICGTRKVVTPSQRPESHNSDQPTYKSLIFRSN
jgi:hypothetical protein